MSDEADGAGQSHRQVWQCACGRARSWGTGYPEDPDRLVWLTCDNCETVTEHAYWRIKTYEARPIRAGGEA